MNVQDDSAPGDFTLIERARQGDANAFGELVNRHYHRCMNLARWFLRDPACASDEVQNACWKAFAHLDQYQGTAEFGTWLSTIVINECRMVLRRDSNKNVVYLDGPRSGLEAALPAAAEDPERDLIKRDMTLVIRREIRLWFAIIRSARNLLTPGQIERKNRNSCVCLQRGRLPVGEGSARFRVSIKALGGLLKSSRSVVSITAMSGFQPNPMPPDVVMANDTVFETRIGGFVKATTRLLIGF
jgi:RNA polymerase sigma factor (sigma-70 family)